MLQEGTILAVFDEEDVYKRQIKILYSDSDPF